MRWSYLFITLTALTACLPGDPPSEWATNTPPATQTQETRGVEGILTAIPMPTMTLAPAVTPELPTPTRIMELPDVEFYCPEPSIADDGHEICTAKVMNETYVTDAGETEGGGLLVPGEIITVDLTRSSGQYCVLYGSRSSFVSCWDIAWTGSVG